MKTQNLIYSGAQNKKSGYDLSIPDNFNGTLIYFIHGYKGYKNWGAWDLISDYFYDRGFGFAKCNLSHNGTTTSKPNSFDDLDSFGRNRYSYELIDVQKFIAEVELQVETSIITKRVLIGHSRGGADAILSISNCPQIDILITWASISNIENRFLKGDQLKVWKEKNVFHVLNGRTQQNMPHFYSFYTDYLDHKNELNIQEKAHEISIPWAIIHGTNDTSVKPIEAENLKEYSKNSELIWIKNANHVFGAKEPFSSLTLPTDSIFLIERTLDFIKKIN